MGHLKHTVRAAGLTLIVAVVLGAAGAASAGAAAR
jgi:hypothetical protein